MNTNRKKKKVVYKPIPKKRTLKKRLIDLLSISSSTGKEKEYFIENFSMLISSGTDIISAIDAIKKEIKSKPLQQKLEEFREKIDSGLSVWGSLDDLNMLPRYMITLIRIGEEGGHLPRQLNVIVEQQQKNRDYSAKVKSAMIYPALLISITFIIGIVFIWFILPNLTSVFEGLNIELPITTKFLIWLRDFVGEWGYIVVPGAITIMLLLNYFLFISSKTKFIGQRLLFTIPVVRTLVVNSQISRFGFILGSLFDAGMPIVIALDSMHEVTEVVMYKKFYGYLKDVIDEGKSFEEAMNNYPKIKTIVPITVQQLIFTSEKSGRLAENLKNIGKTYEMKVDNSSKNLTVLLEPLMIIVVWVGVLFLALSIIGPIYDLVGGVSTTTGINNPNKSSKNSGTPTPIPTIVAEESERKQLTVKSNSLGFIFIREKPGSDEQAITQAVSGEVYEYIQERKGWYEVIISGTEVGWIDGEYIEINE